MGEKTGDGLSSAIVGLVSANLEKIAERSRSFILMACIVALVILGLVVVTNDPLIQATALLIFFALMLSLTFLLYQVARESSGGTDDSDIADVVQAIGGVNGQWWQLVVSDRSPGLSLITVDLSVLPNRHGLSGMKFATSGKFMSDWTTRAVALMSVKPLELFYYWKGSHADQAKELSGLGYFIFSTEESRGMAGRGWFTTGDVEGRDFNEWSVVHLRRVNQDERDALEVGGTRREEMVRGLYTAWLAEMEFARSSSEPESTNLNGRG